MKKLLTLLLVGASVFFLQTKLVHAAAPVLTLANTGDGDNVTVTVTGDANSSVMLYFMSTTGSNRLQYIGTTNASGFYSTILSTATLAVTPDSPVQAKINNVSSNSVNWPYNNVSGTGAITLSNTGLILTVGNTSTLTVNNVGTSKIYLSNNTNPQIANISLNNNQATIYANAYGQTVMTVCVLGTTNNCASAYITVQNSGTQPLTLSQSTLTIAYGQSTTVTVLNSTGNYTILNNSNPSVITASILNQTITLNATNNGGSAAITVCASDMSACGIINASVGSVSSSALTFSQTAPTLSISQTLPITISGGTGTYNISSNSNSNIVGANINNTNTLNLVGNAAGSSVITVCSSNGNCNSLTATVSYASSGGPISLSQTSLWLQAGQAVSVVVSGGTAPYSFVNDANSATLFQSSLNNNILTLTGIKAGSATLSVCSAGGACTSLAVLVNGVSTNTQLTFGSNNLTMIAGANSDVTLYGAGGYYISNTNNQNVATFLVSGNKITVSALAAGNANVTVCQTGGQCGVIYVAVSATTTQSTISFSNSNPTVSVGQSSSVSISGGSGTAYYISSNSNPTIAQANIDSNVLSIVGKVSGSTTINVCSSSNSCNSLSVNVINSVATNDSDKGQTTTTPPATTGDSVLNAIASESAIVFAGNAEAIATTVKSARNSDMEDTYSVKYVSPLIKGLSLNASALNTLNYFIVYGTPSTLKLGAGERAGVLSSYLQAYGKLPVTQAEWSDLYKISVGRWPSVLSPKAEAQAKVEFTKVYNRAANLSNNKDLNAITVIAYGLRPTARNTKSEKAAILSFRSVYGHAPINPLAWNIVRAIAYSGTSR